MKVAASVYTAADVKRAEETNADLIEFRLDLAHEDPGVIRSALSSARVPIIMTLRSAHEGGGFRGDEDAWFSAIEPHLACAAYVDVERRFKEHAGRIRALGIRVIASLHTRSTPGREVLRGMEAELRSYGDLPKIVVAVKARRDLLELLEFTLEAEKPIVTGTCGEEFRCSRFLLPIFGSEIVYCHAGRPTAEGQYHVDDWRRIFSEITGMAKGE